MDDVRIHTGTLVADLLLPHAQSIKDRRQALRSLTQRLVNRRFAVAQVGPTELRQRAFLAVTAVSGSAAGLDALLDEAERLMFASAFDVGDLRRDVRQDAFPSA
jgi:uncharacterized protein YlxP (DUF503 family)